ncbi:helix-turn-helix domain-containing protein [Gordonia sp. CPCC 205515]|uniref:TetR/AcrR family transcriptional regulator n=1 Tax=Gordonia sp. CPCC 205515 TaxID=3140791 RepID=UPI003AF3D794
MTTDNSDRRVAARPSAARQRILDAADHLFYLDGVRAVGVDRIIGEAAVTRATFYRHFPSKETLVEAYLGARADRARAAVAALRAAMPDDPRAVLDAIARGLAEECAIDGFRGCEFINAAAEFADESAAARRMAVDQRRWVLDVTTDLLAELGRPRPRETAEALLLLRTGAYFATGLDRSPTAYALYLRMCDAVIDGHIEA